MKGERRSEAIWIESKKYWQIKVQKNGVRKGFTSSTPGRRGKHEAENKADDWLERGTSDMRFQQAWEDFLKWHKAHNGSQNYIKHESAGRLYILPAVGNRKISAITASVWQKAIDRAVDAGLSRRSCINIRGSIIAFLRYARRERLDVIQIEADDLVIPNSAAPEKEKHVLSRDELNTLFSDATFVHHNKPVVCQFAYAWRFLVATGMRRGELAGLRNEDIYDRMIHIRRSINSIGEETSGKNDNARRDFIITDTMMEILDAQREFLKQKMIISPWVFPDEHGDRADPKHIYTQWRAYCGQHNIKCTLHELRHTFISINKADLPIELLKSVVGHSSSMDTFAVYGHEVDGDKVRAASIIDATFKQFMGK